MARGGGGVKTTEIKIITPFPHVYIVHCTMYIYYSCRMAYTKSDLTLPLSLQFFQQWVRGEGCSARSYLASAILCSPVHVTNSSHYTSQLQLPFWRVVRSNSISKWRPCFIVVWLRLTLNLLCWDAANCPCSWLAEVSASIPEICEQSTRWVYHLIHGWINYKNTKTMFGYLFKGTVSRVVNFFKGLSFQ